MFRLFFIKAVAHKNAHKSKNTKISLRFHFSLWRILYNSRHKFWINRILQTRYFSVSNAYVKLEKKNDFPKATKRSAAVM